MINIVCSIKVSNEIKKSKYFRHNLGLSISHEDGRGIRRTDKFLCFYMDRYRSAIFAFGNIGMIKLYYDHYIKGDTMAIYNESDENIFEFDYIYAREHGIDSYLGKLIKEIETKNTEVEELKDDKYIGDATKIFNNPGQVRYADLVKYLEEKKRDKFKH